MLQSKLIQVLQTLSDKELKQFQGWLAADIFNKNETIRQFYALILPFAPNFDTKKAILKLDKKLIFERLYKNEIYDNFKMNSLGSDTYQLLCNFLAYENFQRSQQFANLCLMDELYQKGLHKNVEQEARKFKQRQVNSTIRNADFYYDEYLFYKQKDALFLSKPNRMADVNLQLKNDYLDLFYFAMKLKIACDMTSRNTVIQANYQSSFLAELRLRYENEPEKYNEIPAITVYYQVLQMLLNADESKFYYQLKTHLAENIAQFPNEELRILYDYVRNYCIRKINDGETEYYQEILNLYQFLLDKKIIFQNGYLTEWDYKNITTVGLRLETYDWTEKFIINYKNSLPESVRENAFIYNLASFYYEKNEYKKSLQLLHEVKFTDTTYHLGAKIIQLKSYYELKETEPFYALTDAFQIFVKRNRQLSDYRKTAYLNLISITKKVYKLREQQGVIANSVWNNRHQILKEKIDNQRIANKDWILDIFEVIHK
jgi:hypothetical protein